jgi:hypothetical protein
MNWVMFGSKSRTTDNASHRLSSNSYNHTQIRFGYLVRFLRLPDDYLVSEVSVAVDLG